MMFRALCSFTAITVFTLLLALFLVAMVQAVSDPRPAIYTPDSPGIIFQTGGFQR